MENLRGDTPEARLVGYLTTSARDGALRRHARLTIRALLDADPAARDWPLRGFLDALVDLARATRRWRDADRTEILGAIYVVIGAVQYAAISDVTVTGMYGADTAARLRTDLTNRIDAAIAALVEE